MRARTRCADRLALERDGRLRRLRGRRRTECQGHGQHEDPSHSPRVASAGRGRPVPRRHAPSALDSGRQRGKDSHRARREAGARRRRREPTLDRLGHRAGSRTSAGATLAFTYQGERIEANVARAGRQRRQRAVLSRATSRATRTSTRSSRRSREALGAASTCWCTASRSRRRTISRAASPTRSATTSARAGHQRATRSSAMTRRAEPLMGERGGGSVVTMTYLGGERAVPHYNVMGVAKAALESSMRYLAADLGDAEHPRQRDHRRAGAHARGPLDHGLHDDGGDRRRAGAAQAQHRRRPTSARPRCTCCRPLAASVTGTILYVDAGYHAMGM